jgi:hypothetical protein
MKNRCRNKDRNRGLKCHGGGEEEMVAIGERHHREVMLLGKWTSEEIC